MTFVDLGKASDAESLKLLCWTLHIVGVPK